MVKDITNRKTGTADTEAGVDEPSAKRSAEEMAALQKKAEQYIDDFMIHIGYSDPAERTDEDGWRYFNLGSAEGRAGVFNTEDYLLLRVEAPIMSLPSDQDLILPLLRELMEFNMMILGECRIGIINETIYAAITYPVNALEEGDIRRCIDTVLKTADHLDDALMQKYGGTSIKREE